MTGVLPFQLMDGQKAYAAKLMANFNYLLGIVDNVTVPGAGQMPLDEALAALRASIANCVASNEEGNAREIYFTDGVSLQAKLTNGDLKGADGVVSTSDGMYYFYVGGDGHLYLVTRSQVQGDAFAVNDQGHLIYTVTDPGSDPGDPKTYDLGSVRFDGVSSAEFEDYKVDVTEEIATAVSAVGVSHSYSATLYAASFAGEVTTATVTLEQMTATCNFIVSPAANATATQRAAWRSGVFSVTAQSTGGFTLTRDGEVPAVDIPLAVVIVP